MKKQNHQPNGKLGSITMIFLLCFSLSYGQSPDLKFDHLTTENGLPQNTIHGIAKDKYGFMWFGTWSGLCRYDGYNFKIYRHQPGNNRSINNSRIHNIISDSAQNLWIQTFDESVACRYNYETDDFDRFPASRVSPSLMKLLNRRDHYSNIAFSFKQFRWTMDIRTNSLVQTYLPTGEKGYYTPNSADRWSLNDSYVTDIYLDNQNIFWVGTYSNGINKANLNRKPFQYFYHDPDNKKTIIDNNVRSICEDRQGNLWIGTRDKGITVLSKANSFRNFQSSESDPNTINSDQIKKIFCDSRGLVWIGTKKGLDRYDPFTNRLNHYEKLGLKNISVYGIIEDRKKNIWIASWQGLYKFEAGTDSLVHYEPSGLLKHKHVMVIMEDSTGNLWAGTEGGGITILKETGQGDLKIADNLQHADNVPNTVSDNRIYSIHEDEQHFVWIGTGNGLDRFDPRSHQFRHFTVSANGLASATICGILEDKNGFIWVSHKKGISRINTTTFEIRNYSIQDGLQVNEFSDGAVFKSPSTGMMYFGGNNGYNTFYPDSIKTDRSLPRVVLTELQVLNKPITVNDTVNGRILLHKPLYLTSEISLNYQDKSIAVEFAGLHYANPSGNKYAYMLEGFDKDWIYTDATNRIATYSNLSRGNYTFKVKASNSDGIWNTVPTTLQIVVLPPWWTSTVAFIFYAFIFIGVLYAFYYYSLRYARLKNKLDYEHLLHEKQLEMRQSKIEFFTNISHEIKTPLSLILAPIERLLAEGKDNPRIAGQLHTMKSSGDRLLKLINQLLDIRRFETGNDKLRLQEDDLVSFVKRIVDSFAPLAAEKNILLEFNTTVSILATSFDPDKIEKVLYNLLSNAFKFTPQEGKINVFLRYTQEAADNHVLIKVIDNGAGIPKNELETIFKPFEQASTNKAGGTGLGLAYAKALVALHGGTIYAESANDDNGQHQTCFTVKLPVNLKASLNGTAADISEDIIAEDTIPVLADAIKIDGKAPTLLLVEDSFELRKYLREYFAAFYRVLEAENGADGLVLADEYTPDLVISDMMMPEMDGLELCRRLKSGTMTSHIPVILLTARTPVEYQIEGIETGADDYMTKPFNLQLLSTKVNNLLITRIKLREKYKSGINIHPSATTPESPDDKLLRKVIEMVEKNIADPELDVGSIGDHIGLSRTQLYRKMKALTGLSMGEVIKDIRLKYATQLLTGKKFNVNEVAYMVGFIDTHYFRKCFKARFGLTPSDYTKKTIIPADHSMQ